MEVSQKLHYDSLDAAKGMAIVLVVLGHCFPNNIFGGTDRIDQIAAVLYQFIYSFHMPVFFTISGFLFYHSWREHRKGTLKKKVIRLIIPYLTFSILYIPLRIFLSGMANSDYGNHYWKILFGVSPNGGVWFLYVLFLFFVFTFYIVTNKNIEILLFIAFVLSVVSHSEWGGGKITYSIWRYSMNFYLYFLIGTYSGLLIKHKRINSTKIYGHLPVKAVLFLIMFYVLIRWDVQFLSVVLGAIGTNIVLIVAHRLQGARLFQYFGQISMDIYLLHGPLLVGFRWLYGRIEIPKVLFAGCLFFPALVVSVFISKFLLRKSKWLGFICLGVRRERKV